MLLVLWPQMNWWYGMMRYDRRHDISVRIPYAWYGIKLWYWYDKWYEVTVTTQYDAWYFITWYVTQPNMVCLDIRAVALVGVDGFGAHTYRCFFLFVCVFLRPPPRKIGILLTFCWYLSCFADPFASQSRKHIIMQRHSSCPSSHTLQYRRQGQLSISSRSSVSSSRTCNSASSSGKSRSSRAAAPVVISSGSTS